MVAAAPVVTAPAAAVVATPAVAALVVAAPAAVVVAALVVAAPAAAVVAPFSVVPAEKYHLVKRKSSLNINLSPTYNDGKPVSNAIVDPAFHISVLTLTLLWYET